MDNHKLLAVATAMCILSVCTFAVFTAEEEETDGFVITSGLVVAAIFLAGAALGVSGTLVTQHFWPHEAGDGGNTDELKQQYRTAEAKKIINEQHNMLELITNKTTSTAPTLNYISTYAQRQAEISCAEVWTIDRDYSPNAVLSNSIVYDRMAAEAQAAAFYIGETFRPLDNLIVDWNKADVADTYGKNAMQVGFIAGSAEYITNASSTATPYGEYGMAATITSAAEDRIYIRSTDGFLYVDGGNAVITDGAGKDYLLNEGRNDISAMEIPSGVYEAQAGRSYLGSITQVATTDTAQVTPGVALVVDGNATLASFNGQNANILDGGTKGDNTELSFAVKHANYVAGDNAVSIIPAFRSISAVLESCTFVVDAAAEAAQAQWTIFDACGESNAFISPSSILTSYNNYTLTSDERALIYTSAMQQISDYYERNENNLNKMKITLSLNAMGLLCKGDIIDNSGKKLAEDVLFTPLTYLKNQTITTGTVDWNQIGIAAVWGPANIATNTGEAANTISMQPGYKLDINSMTLKGEAVNSFTLEVLDVPDLIEGDYVPPEPLPPIIPDVVELSPIIFAIIILVGAIIALIGYISGNVIIMGIGAAAILVGGLGVGLNWRFPWT